LQFSNISFICNKIQIVSLVPTKPHTSRWNAIERDTKLTIRIGRGPGGRVVPTFSQEELRLAVEEAHSAGRRVSMHATTAEGMRRAVLAGIDAIKHGYGGIPEVFKLMAERALRNERRDRL
jgi:hypothetical protein